MSLSPYFKRYYAIIELSAGVDFELRKHTFLVSEEGSEMPIPDHLHGRSAKLGYLPKLRQLVASYEAPRILELGGGRNPSFSLDQLPSNIASYTVNDISADELALTGPEYEKALFDVAGDVSRFEGQFDIVFSRTLMEHVPDGQAMHRNVLSLLKPGGVAFHMGPTLYAPAFVLNKLLPEGISRSILFAFFPSRRSERPKFPAYYSWCFGNSSKMRQMLNRIGYRAIEVKTFYGTHYFKKVPIIREIDGAFQSLAARRNWSTFGSYIHIIAKK